MAVAAATAEVAGADLPDDVRAGLAVIAAVPALAGVLCEAAAARALADRQHGVGRERTEAHRRDVHHRRRVGDAALLAADRDPDFARRIVGDGHRPGRVADEPVAFGVDVLLGPEGLDGGDALRAPVHDVALVAIERAAAGIALYEVLMQLGAGRLEQVAHAAEQRVVAHDRVRVLEAVVQGEQGDRHHQQRQPVEDRRHPGGEGPRAEKQPEHRGHDEGADPVKKLHPRSLRRAERGARRVKAPPALGCCIEA